MRTPRTITTDVPLIVLDDDEAVAEYAERRFRAGIPLAVVSGHYSDVIPYMLHNNGHTVALVADVNDPVQLAETIVLVERRLGRVGSVIRYGTDLPATAFAPATGAASVA
ncbi:MAG: hypothetical protein QM673_02765 [Gordonia sp. (in: high G+C Gram-positive bacteria)]